MTYLDLALWVSAIVLWICVVWKIVGSVIEWFDGIKKTRTEIALLHQKINSEHKHFDNTNDLHWKLTNELKARIEKLEKKCKK